MLKTPGENCKNCKIGNFDSSSIWLKEALERENQVKIIFYHPVCHLYLVNTVLANEFDEM